MDKHDLDYVGVGHNIEEAWSAKYLKGTDNNVAIIAASYTCFNDKNKKDCDYVARLSDDPKYLKEAIKKVKEENPKVFVVVQMHAGKEYDIFHN